MSKTGSGTLVQAVSSNKWGQSERWVDVCVWAFWVYGFVKTGLLKVDKISAHIVGTQ